jgi:hypothetical protein
MFRDIKANLEIVPKSFTINQMRLIAKKKSKIIDMKGRRKIE